MLSILSMTRTFTFC